MFSGDGSKTRHSCDLHIEDSCNRTHNKQKETYTRPTGWAGLGAALRYSLVGGSTVRVQFGATVAKKLTQSIADNAKEEARSAHLPSQDASLSLKHFVWIQRPRGRKGGSSPEGQLTVEDRQNVNMCTVEVHRMRRWLARRREVPQHTGVRQHDPARAKVGSIYSSNTTRSP